MISKIIEFSLSVNHYGYTAQNKYQVNTKYLSTYKVINASRLSTLYVKKNSETTVGPPIGQFQIVQFRNSVVLF